MDGLMVQRDISRNRHGAERVHLQPRAETRVRKQERGKARSSKSSLQGCASSKNTLHTQHHELGAKFKPPQQTTAREEISAVGFRHCMMPFLALALGQGKGLPPNVPDSHGYGKSMTLKRTKDSPRQFDPGFMDILMLHDYEVFISQTRLQNRS